jgi:5-methylcytosine-specific restriction endonuclease McrA
MKSVANQSSQVHLGFLLRLYAHSLRLCCDGNFMVGALAALQRRLSRDKEKKGIIFTPQGQGFAHFLAARTIEDFFENQSEDHPLYSWYAYDVLDVIDDVFGAWELIDFGGRLDQKLGELVGTFGYEYDKTKNVDTRVDMLIDRGATIARLLLRECTEDPKYRSLVEVYACEVADRFVHDRQIAHHLAGELTRIAPGAKRNRHTKFVRRMKLPEFVKPILMARDRGKCAICTTDIVGELLAKIHIDHIYPLAHGGCNDIVKLQLCCETCNRSKSDQLISPRSSVPQYHSRFFKDRVRRPK